MSHLLDAILNGPARYTQRHNFGSGWALVFVLGILFAECVLVYVLFMAAFKFAQNARPMLGLILRRFGIAEPEVDDTFLALTFPSDTSKSAYATEQLHILLRTIVVYRGKKDMLAAHKKPYSLELVGTHDDGIRYILKLSTYSVETVQRRLLSFLPGIKIQPVDDYLADVTHTKVGIVELQLSSDYVLPLQSHKALTEHDPIGTLIAQMTKLGMSEVVAMQLVAVPVLNHTHHRVLRHLRDIRGRIALGKELSGHFAVQRNPKAYFPTTTLVPAGLVYWCNTQNIRRGHELSGYGVVS